MIGAVAGKNVFHIEQNPENIRFYRKRWAKNMCWVYIVILRILLKFLELKKAKE